MLLTEVYYQLKPVIPRRVRLAIRRARARRLRRQRRDSWPIDEAAGRLPVWWPGWPGGAQFAFVLTHDVEGSTGLGRCRALADLETSLGFRSSFNFVPEGEYKTPETLRRLLTDRGFEIGVHDLHHDGKLYRSRAAFKRNARRINHYLQSWEAVGFRSGFMLHNLDWLRDLEILYDLSTFDTDPFEPQPDGANTIFPFKVARSDGTSYVELPYTLPQDSTLFLVLQETTPDVWKHKLDWVARCGGLALLNVHPDYINFDRTTSSMEYDAGLYRALLEHVTREYRDRCWSALPRDVASYIHQLPEAGPVRPTVAGA
jgi:hypothetical protein